MPFVIPAPIPSLRKEAMGAANAGIYISLDNPLTTLNRFRVKHGMTKETGQAELEL